MDDLVQLLFYSDLTYDDREWVCYHLDLCGVKPPPVPLSPYLTVNEIRQLVDTSWVRTVNIR